MCNLLASDALGAMETSPNDKASEASESCSDSTRPTSLAMTEAPHDDQLSEEWEHRRDEHDVADKEEEETEADEGNEEKIEAGHFCQMQQQAVPEERLELQVHDPLSDESAMAIEANPGLVETPQQEATEAAEEKEERREEGQVEGEHFCGEEPEGLDLDNLPPPSVLACPGDEPKVNFVSGLVADLVKPLHPEEHEEGRAASRARLLSGPWDEVLDDEDDEQVDEYAEHSYSPWERLLTKHLPTPERIEEGNEKEEDKQEEEAEDKEAEIEWGPHWNEANHAAEEDQQASRWSRGWGAESEYESLSDGWMVPFDDLIHGATNGSCFNAHSLSQPMPMAHAAEVFGENAVWLWSTANPSGGVDGQISTDGDDIPKEVFTNGQQVFKPVPSADGQTLFTDGARLYASVCVVMGPPSTDVAKSDGNLPLHQPGQLESQLKWSYEASDDEWD